MRAVGWINVVSCVTMVACGACQAIHPSGDSERVAAGRERRPHGSTLGVPLVKIVPASSAPPPENSAERGAHPAPPPPSESGETSPAPGASGTPLLAVKRFAITNEIRDREPVLAHELSVGAPVVAFLELTNPADVELVVQVTFRHESGRSTSVIELPIPARKPRWRTWARSELVDESGTWTAVVSQKNGSELDRRSFLLP